VDPFVAQLARLCTTYRTRAKWVFVPTHALGRTLGERIALEGTNWLNLRFVTPLDVALHMGAPFLVERGVDPSEEGLGPALIMRLLLDLPESDGYFRTLADQPTMAQALWSTVRELRMTGVKANDLKVDLFESPAKHVELRALLSAYERYLEREKRGDMASVYEEALTHPTWCPIEAQDCWTELPHATWTPLQRRLIDGMPGERISPRAMTLTGRRVPRRLAASHLEPVKPEHATNPLAFLLAPGQSPFPKIQLFHAGGREAEIEEVFRRILKSGVPLDHVEIACASDAHVALTWEKALRQDWAVTLGPGIAAAQTRPGRALIGFCDWIETEFTAGHFRRLVQSGDLGIEPEKQGFTAGEAARLLARSDAGWGRETYAVALGRLCQDYESRAVDPDESNEDRKDARAKADLTTRVLAWITQLVESIPEPATLGQVPLQAVVEAAVGFIEHTTARKSALDHRAASALIDYIGELRALGSFSCPLPGSLRFIRERVQSLQVAPERPRPGHLYVSTLAQAGYAGRPHVFVVGLEEGRVFPSAAEDPVLLDAERSAISPLLRSSTDRIDEAVYATLGRLAVSGKTRITFSYSCRDTREFRETYASWLALQVFRVQQGDGDLSYQQMKAVLAEPKSVVATERDAASSSGGWWLRSIVGSGSAGADAVGAAFGGVSLGRKAGEARVSGGFTEFDGYVPAAGAVLDPCADGTALSVTELEGVADCPFRFFLKRGLGIRPVDERERDKDVWLDPLTRGSELHALYASFLRRCREAGRRPDEKEDGAWLKSLAQARLTELQREMPAATTEILERESKDYLADVELFLNAECANSASTPIAFEVSFGRPLQDALEPLARAEPVEIDLGQGLKFRLAGRIDRIDKVGADAFEVIDYKTGGFWRTNWDGTFDGGRRLQHALYGLAATELLRSQYKNPQVVAGVYYHSSHKGRLERVRIPAPGLPAITRLLREFRELILQGSFVHAPGKDDCRFCEYASACGVDMKQQANTKLQDARLIAYGRLAAHA
jgi:RecB family exonuclease